MPNDPILFNGGRIWTIGLSRTGVKLSVRSLFFRGYAYQMELIFICAQSLFFLEVCHALFPAQRLASVIGWGSIEKM